MSVWLFRGIDPELFPTLGQFIDMFFRCAYSFATYAKANVPAEKAAARESARVPQAHEVQGWPHCSQASPCKGPQAPHRHRTPALRHSRQNPAYSAGFCYDECIILSIFGLYPRKLAQRTMKYASQALLDAHRNFSKILHSFRFILCLLPSIGCENPWTSLAC